MTALRWEHTQETPSTWRAEHGPYLAIVRRVKRVSGSYWAARVERHDTYVVAAGDVDMAELTPIESSATAVIMRLDAAKLWCVSTIDDHMAGRAVWS